MAELKHASSRRLLAALALLLLLGAAPALYFALDIGAQSDGDQALPDLSGREDSEQGARGDPSDSRAVDSQRSSSLADSFDARREHASSSQQLSEQSGSPSSTLSENASDSRDADATRSGQVSSAPLAPSTARAINTLVISIDFGPDATPAALALAQAAEIGYSLEVWITLPHAQSDDLALINATRDIPLIARTHDVLIPIDASLVYQLDAISFHAEVSLTIPEPTQWMLPSGFAWTPGVPAAPRAWRDLTAPRDASASRFAASLQLALPHPVDQEIEQGWTLAGSFKLPADHGESDSAQLDLRGYQILYAQHESPFPSAIRELNISPEGSFAVAITDDIAQALLNHSPRLRYPLRHLEQALRKPVVVNRTLDLGEITLDFQSFIRLHEAPAPHELAHRYASFAELQALLLRGESVQPAPRPWNLALEPGESIITACGLGCVVRSITAKLADGTLLQGEIIADSPHTSAALPHGGWLVRAGETLELAVCFLKPARFDLIISPEPAAPAMSAVLHAGSESWRASPFASADGIRYAFGGVHGREASAAFLQAALNTPLKLELRRGDVVISPRTIDEHALFAVNHTQVITLSDEEAQALGATHASASLSGPLPESAQITTRLGLPGVSAYKPGHKPRVRVMVAMSDESFAVDLSATDIANEYIDLRLITAKQYHFFLDHAAWTSGAASPDLASLPMQTPTARLQMPECAPPLWSVPLRELLVEAKGVENMTFDVRVKAHNYTQRSSAQRGVSHATYAKGRAPLGEIEVSHYDRKLQVVERFYDAQRATLILTVELAPQLTITFTNMDVARWRSLSAPHALTVWVLADGAGGVNLADKVRDGVLVTNHLFAPLKENRAENVEMINVLINGITVFERMVRIPKGEHKQITINLPDMHRVEVRSEAPEQIGAWEIKPQGWEQADELGRLRQNSALLLPADSYTADPFSLHASDFTFVVSEESAVLELPRIELPVRESHIRVRLPEGWSLLEMQDNGEVWLAEEVTQTDSGHTRTTGALPRVPLYRIDAHGCVAQADLIVSDWSGVARATAWLRLLPEGESGDGAWYLADTGLVDFPATPPGASVELTIATLTKQDE